MPEVPGKLLELVVERGTVAGVQLQYLLLLLPAASLLEGQVDDSTTGHVVVSQGVGILDEDALEDRQCLTVSHLSLTTHSLTQLSLPRIF